MARSAILHIIPNTMATLAIAGLIIGSTPGVAYAIDAGATPQGSKVVAGTATFSRPTTSSLVVTQKSQRAVIDWQSFNIGTKGSVEFKQAGASSLAVNRVTGKSADPTQILGTLKSNGQVMVLDPNGVFFGQSARIDVGGIIASTGGINVNQVMSNAAKIDITGIGGGSIVNQGQITAKQGGLVALVAPHVVNSGVITANLGRAELASGSAVTLDLYGDKLVALAVNGALANALVENSGTIAADGGRVALTARAAQGVVNNVINTTGIIRANTVGKVAGRIVLSGNDAGAVRVAGKIDATTTDKKGTTGGRVDMTGSHIVLDKAQVNVSGNTGGGQVYAGGGLYGALDGTSRGADVTDVSAGTLINANALTNGNGGTVVVWGNHNTNYLGKTTARGGASGGNGGLVEVSTGEGVNFAGMVDTTAAKGKVGTLLIDPISVSIGNGPDTIDGAYLNAQNIADNLVFTSIEVQADNNIDFVDDIDVSSSPYGLPAFSLLLTAPTLNFDHNLNMGSLGLLFLNADAANLSARITSGGSAINPARVLSTVTQANVLSNAASIQQAMDISSASAPVTVHVAAGEYHENLTIDKAGLTLTGNDGTEATGADPVAPEIFGTVAGGNIITVAANNVTIDGLHFNAEVGDELVADSVNGIYANGVDSLTIRHNTLEGFTGTGISTPGSTNVTLNANKNILSAAQQAAADAAAITAAQNDAAAAATAGTQAAAGASSALAAQAAATTAATAAAQAAADAAAAAQAPASTVNAAAAQTAADAAAAAAAQAAAQASAAAAAQASAAAAATAAAQAAADAAAIAAAQTAAGTAAAAATQAAADAAAATAAQAATDAANAAAASTAAAAAETTAVASATAAQASADAAAAVAGSGEPNHDQGGEHASDKAKEHANENSAVQSNKTSGKSEDHKKNKS
jgi:filamentous hemagglutinin family protein